MKNIRMNGDDRAGERHIEWERIEVEGAGYIGIIRLKKSPRNSIGSWLLDAVYDRIAQFERDADGGALIIGSMLKGVFSDGADRDELFGSWISGLVAEKNYDRFRRAHQMFMEIENCKKPIIAAINGVTIGAGLELAMLCDLRVSSEIAFFSLPEAKPELAIIPGLGATQRLTRLVGVARAKEMLYLGKMLRAQTAYDWGLVNMLVPHDEVMDNAVAVARELVRRDGRALADLKACINFAADNGIEDGVEFEVSRFAEIMRLKLGGDL